MLNKKSLLVAGIALIAVCGSVYAGTDNQEFDAVYKLLTDWSTGTLGKIIALAALIVGIAFGLIRQSVVAAVVGIAMALVLNYGPKVIDGIFTATTVTADISKFTPGLF